MEYGILNQPAVTLYELAGSSKTAGGERVTAIADEGLYGMAVRITGEEENGYLPVLTHYGYSGYVKKGDMLPAGEEQVKQRELPQFKVVDAAWADVLSLPRVQGMRLISLGRGCILEVMGEEGGWSSVRLADGSMGYLMSRYLEEKQFSQSRLWEDRLPQAAIVDEEEFRERLVRTAVSYLGTQYRWGGKSSLGIDCSGLTSMAYMLNGILIYRDARMMEGYPVKEIPFVQKKPGDLLYFPGHIAMYLGDDAYIHSTGNVGSGGVAVNSLNPSHDGYRADMAGNLLAVGSIFG